MKKLRILSFLLILALFIGIFTACNNPKAGWEDTLTLRTFGEVRDHIGEPDVPMQESILEADEYHDVTLGGVEGIFTVADYSYFHGGRRLSGKDYDSAHEKTFYAITACNDKKVQEILPQLEETAVGILDHLTFTYGQPRKEESDDGTTYRWSKHLSITKNLSIRFFFPNFSTVSNPEMPASQWGADYLYGDDLLFLRVEYLLSEVIVN